MNEHAPDPNTEGERRMAILLQQAALREASLINSLAAVEVELYAVRNQLAEAHKVMTPRQLEKLQS